MAEQALRGNTRKTSASNSESLAQQAKRYFLRAVLLVAILTVAGNSAPYLPPAVIPIFLVLFALLSIVGAMYHTVIHRTHRQFKYEEGGDLSHFNRRWPLRMLLFLILFLVSGFFFLLEAPKWDSFEWLLTWIAIPLYFCVYVLVLHRLKKEYRPKFRKSHAIRWSFWIVGAILCLAYAALSQSLATHHYNTLAEAFEQAPNPFESSPSALMNEAGILSSFTDGISNFGLAQITESSLVVGFACHFAVYAVVFFGLVNQFSFCLLSFGEIKSEFQLLPPYDEQHTGNTSKAPIRKRYIALVSAVSLVVIAAFMVADHKIATLQTTQEHLRLAAFVEEHKEELIKNIDGIYKEYEEKTNLQEEYALRLEELHDKRNDELIPLIEGYYTQCRSNIDFYLEWHDGPMGKLAQFLKPFGNPLADDAVKTFRERITHGASASDIEEKYQSYQEQIVELRKEALYATTSENLSPFFQEDALLDGTQGEGKRYTLDLWQPLNAKSTTSDILLNSDANLSPEEFKEKIRNLIDQAQTDAMKRLENTE